MHTERQNKTKNKKQKKETSCKKEQVNARKHSAHQASQSQKKTRWKRKVMSTMFTKSPIFSAYSYWLKLPMEMKTISNIRQLIDHVKCHATL